MTDVLLSARYSTLPLTEFLDKNHADPILAQTAKTLLRACRTKDPGELEERLPGLSTLVLSRDPWSVNGPPLSLSFVRHLPALRELEADYQRSVEGVSPLQGLKLRKLSLKSFGTVHAGLIGSLASLEVLELGECAIDDPSKLGSLGSLVHLGLAKVGLKDASFLEGMHSLVFLDLAENHLSRLPPIEGAISLKTLRVAKNMIDDLTLLSKLRSLKEIDISDNSVADLDPLTSLRDLQTLRFTRNRVRSVKPLRDLDMLEVVSLSMNPVHEDEIDEVLRRRVRLE